MHYLCAWGPALSHDLSARLVKMHNRAIRVIGGLKKFDHVSSFRRQLTWLSVDSLTQHCCDAMIYRYYNSGHNNCILLIHPSSSVSSPLTRSELVLTLLLFILLNYIFHKSFSALKEYMHWWNSLPAKLLDTFPSYNQFK